jgi:putative ABC transport system permease protein
MIALAWHTARARAGSLAGSFVALALGVALLSSVILALASTVGAGGPPRWFTTADVVVSGQDSVAITSGAGDDRETSAVRTEGSRAVPASLVPRLSALGADMVVDYAAYARVPGAAGDTLHPWAAASLHRYTWVAGTPPRGPGQLVLTAPTSLRPGDQVTAQTAAGPRRFTVSGVIRTSAQPASYGTGPVAASLAGGRIDAIALTTQERAAHSVGSPGGLPARVAAITRGQDLRVLTGDHRRDAEPDPDADLLTATAALLGTTAGLAGFVSVFVVAGTFAYAVAVRRREFGLLRAAGARGRQVRRLVLGEALAVGVIASLVGDALGVIIAAPGARWLASVGFAPPGFTARFTLWPLAAAFGAGLLIALAGAWLASRRAARVRPAEALREAAVDRRAMPFTRWLVGLAALGGSVPLIVLSGHSHSGDTAALFLPVSILLTLGFAMLTPVLAPPLIRLITPALAALGGATGMLAARSAATGVRRTAATVAPILLTVGIAGSLMAGVFTFGRTQQDAAAGRVTVSTMVAPGSGSGLADTTVAAIGKVPGVSAAVPVTDTTVYVDNGGPDNWAGEYVPGPALPSVRKLPLVAGSLAALTGTGTVAVPAGQGRLGQVITLWLADSAQVRLRVVAVYADQLDLDQTVLLPWALRDAHTSAPLASAVYLRLSPGAGPGTGQAVSAAAAAGGGTAIKAGSYLSASNAQQDRLNKLALIAILGMALAYTGIAIANTLVMANAARKHELAALRLSGATAGQVLRMIAVEAGLISGLGIALAAAVIAAVVGGLRGALASSAPAVHIVIPWLPVTVIALGCLLTALLASLAPAAISLRRRPVELARALE